MGSSEDGCGYTSKSDKFSSPSQWKKSKGGRELEPTQNVMLQKDMLKGASQGSFLVMRKANPKPTQSGLQHNAAACSGRWTVRYCTVLTKIG
jgi:hypothetical protein